MRFTMPACWRGSSVRAGASSCASAGAATRTWTRLRATSSRLEKALKADGDLKLVVYLMAGHPNRKKSVEVAKRLAASGVAAIEIGVPHSDPLADGPVIQKAGQIALDHGMTVDACLELASEVSGVGAPVVLMSYVNPILAHDPRRFAADAAQAGVAGVIVPDMPIEGPSRSRAGFGRLRSTRSSWSRRPPRQTASAPSASVRAASSTASRSRASPACARIFPRG